MEWDENEILILTVRSPLFLTTHFNIAISSTTVEIFLGYISSKKGLSRGLSLFIPRMKEKREQQMKIKDHNFSVKDGANTFSGNSRKNSIKAFKFPPLTLSLLK